jgi:hypothetical protein
MAPDDGSRGVKAGRRAKSGIPRETHQFVPAPPKPLVCSFTRIGVHPRSVGQKPLSFRRLVRCDRRQIVELVAVSYVVRAIVVVVVVVKLEHHYSISRKRCNPTKLCGARIGGMQQWLYPACRGCSGSVAFCSAAFKL